MSTNGLFMPPPVLSPVSSILTPPPFLMYVCLLSHSSHHPFLSLFVSPQSKPKEKEIKGQRKGEVSA